MPVSDHRDRASAEQRHGHARYWGDFGTTDFHAPVACEGYGNEFNNGLVAIGRARDGHSHTFQDPSSPSDPTKEHRGVRCARMISWGCYPDLSIHVSEKKTGYALRHASKAQAVITALTSSLSAWQVVGAEFYIAY